MGQCFTEQHSNDYWCLIVLLRSVILHVKNQAWVAVLLDFLIVVVGVFLGIQVANWNQDRANLEGVYASLDRLHDEVVQNLQLTQASLNERSGIVELIENGAKALNACETSEGSELRIARAVDAMRFARFPFLIANASTELSRRDAHLALLSEGFRSQLNSYTNQLKKHEQTLALVWAEIQDAAPWRRPAFTVSTQVRLGSFEYVPSLTKSAPVVCADAEFVRDFRHALTGQVKGIDPIINRTQQAMVRFADLIQREQERLAAKVF